MVSRRSNEADEALWLAAMRDTRPLRPRPSPTLADPMPDARPPENRLAALPPTTRPIPRPPFRTGPLELGSRIPGIDDTSWRALRSGRMRPQRRIDLHGRTAQHAFEALHAFLLRCRFERLRCVEVVTGLGSGPDGGILRRELPFWLDRPDIRPMVLAAVHPHDRNAGSVRLLLRRRPTDAPVERGRPARV